jgi:hypothetical protein
VGDWQILRRFAEGIRSRVASALRPHPGLYPRYHRCPKKSRSRVVSALRPFSIRTLVAAKETDLNKSLITQRTPI